MHDKAAEGYSKRADKQHWSQEAPQDGQQLWRAQLPTEHLHSCKHQHWQQTGQHQGHARVHRYKNREKDRVKEHVEAPVYVISNHIILYFITIYYIPFILFI